MSRPGRPTFPRGPLRRVRRRGSPSGWRRDVGERTEVLSSVSSIPWWVSGNPRAGRPAADQRPCGQRAVTTQLGAGPAARGQRLPAGACPARATLDGRGRPRMRCAGPSGFGGCSALVPLAPRRARVTSGRGYGPAARWYAVRWVGPIRRLGAAVLVMPLRRQGRAARIHGSPRARRILPRAGVRIRAEPLVGQGAVVGLRKAALHLTSSHARRPSHFVSANNLVRCRAGGVDARVAQTLSRARRARKSFFRLPRNTPEINAVRRPAQGRRRPSQGRGTGPRASGIQALPGAERRRSRTRELRRDGTGRAPAPRHRPDWRTGAPIGRRCARARTRSTSALSVSRTALRSGHARRYGPNPTIGFEE